jgi:tRNA modification GTPase
MKGDDFIDEVLVTLFRSPASYTGEDGAEISHHASPFIQRTIMEMLLDLGAQAASPGEFTMRAFMNGRIDLSQAEAVADIIAADSPGCTQAGRNTAEGWTFGRDREAKAGTDIIRLTH